jgi:hypothetical protein
MPLLIFLFSCFDKDTAEEEPVCFFYTHCCVYYCEPENETTHYGEPDDCMCEQDTAAPEADQCQLVDGTCVLEE